MILSLTLFKKEIFHVRLCLDYLTDHLFFKGELYFSKIASITQERSLIFTFDVEVKILQTLMYTHISYVAFFKPMTFKQDII